MESSDTYQDDGDDANSYASLISSIPIVNKLFNVYYKVGKGAFSSVFLATLKSSDRSKKFALKQLIPTCHPDRIKRELQYLQQIGGKDYIVGLELCLRHHSSVVFVMPYMRHDKFAEYVQDMTVDETKDYMRALLTALRRVHKFHIIHRDVKPSNFLYDRKNRRYLLVDFGLAQEYYIEKNLEKNMRKTSGESIEAHGTKRKRSNENNISQHNITSKRNVNNKCNCFGKPKVCVICLKEPQQQAPRAGTPGFRAPEVLLKHVMQTSAIDIWSCGVIMLCILSGSQPFFRSSDDCTALAEITTIFGSKEIQKCAQKLGKKIVFNENLPGMDIKSLCIKLKQRNKSMMYDIQNSVYKVPQDIEYPKEAYHLLMKLLDLDFRTRITAEQALAHPFLSL
ncbi:PREDICTED: cell division cycle 7-related protein kinase [Cyphomyrmex costatus]|uniref:non-specific serine/threonine protein kinase n=1 Tax=Cyphomyrmex costatus TaxID=456900 RepID=A0A151IDP4_9HYME|nr:PREDICTED: cell division cycle 7-related protein kinase [Cyphomyrmex costatus]KYM98369.1 putative cell division control protein 7 like protein 2 [Cyphomyrmex costatus]